MCRVGSGKILCSKCRLVLKFYSCIVKNRKQNTFYCFQLMSKEPLQTLNIEI